MAKRAEGSPVEFLDFISRAKRRWAIGSIIAGIVIGVAAIIIGLLEGSGDDASSRGWFEWMGLLSLGLIFGVPLILWLSAKPTKSERDASAAPSSTRTARTDQDSTNRIDTP